MIEYIRRCFVIILAHLLPSCEEVTRMVSERLDRRLGLRERIGLRAHLFVCQWCRRFVRQIAFLRAALERLSEQPGEARLSDEARARMRRLISEFPAPGD